MDKTLQDAMISFGDLLGRNNWVAGTPDGSRVLFATLLLFERPDGCPVVANAVWADNAWRDLDGDTVCQNVIAHRVNVTL